MAADGSKAGCGAVANAGVRDRRMLEAPAELDFLKERNVETHKQSDLEVVFQDFFEGMVSVWNPCHDDDGQCRYLWDEEIGAHDVEVALQGGEEASLSSEQQAIRDVEARWPERLRLSYLLDKVLGAEGDAGGEVVLQSVRRLVAALVQRTARHTKHGKQCPKFGVDPCARGKESCPVCRYGFPHELAPREGARRVRLVKGDREGQWFVRFPRNDALCCSHEEHVLLGNMGNVDWRPCLNLWAVVQYISKYATKAPKGSRRLNEVLHDSVDEVCRYVPEGEGVDFLRRSIQKFFARTFRRA
jgi:hypothetical protein